MFLYFSTHKPHKQPFQIVKRLAREIEKERQWRLEVPNMSSNSSFVINRSTISKSVSQYNKLISNCIVTTTKTKHDNHHSINMMIVNRESIYFFVGWILNSFI